MRFLAITLNKYIVAIILIGLGAGFLLDNFGIWEFDFGNIIATYWPLLLMIFGLEIILESLVKRFRYGGGWIFNFIFGGVLLLLGWNLLAGNLGLTTIKFSLIWTYFWPAILILIGINMLLKGRKGWRNTSVHVYKWHRNDDEPKKQMGTKSSFIGDYKIGREIFELENMNYSNGIGDFDIDLSQAIIPDKENEIIISSFIGDIDLTIPKDLPVYIDVAVKIGELRILGRKEDGFGRGFTYKSPGYDDSTKKLLIKISIVIGDVRIIEAV